MIILFKQINSTNVWDNTPGHKGMGILAMKAYFMHLRTRPLPSYPGHHFRGAFFTSLQGILHIVNPCKSMCRNSILF